MEIRRRKAPYFLVSGASAGYLIALPAVASDPTRQSVTAIRIPPVIAFAAGTIGAAIIAGASFGVNAHRDSP
jgi:hypothetical protein